ncbi:rhombosortase [Microbulbifer celer]|uniref:Rhombosortase n=1 Tax=Microbulbifer celer TaxID=435905 RepID=A0ABW3U866_9GAMM|nr:rhombosortase [Microbulbifer celer]UFN56973.1 rhombosortase [Microbulbifer celer]
MFLLFNRSGLAGPLYLLGIIASVWLCAPVLEPWLVYDRTAIAGGEIWRLLSGHLTHTNLHHLLLNSAGLALLWILHGMHYKIPRFFSAVALIGLGIGIGLYLISPDTDIYLGLSGVLHGLIIWGGMLDIRAGMRTGYLLVAGGWGKVMWEQWFGASGATAQMIDAAVAVDAHLLGAMFGTLLGIMSLIRAHRHAAAPFSLNTHSHEPGDGA